MSCPYQRPLSPELALAIRTLNESAQVARERIAPVLDIPEQFVDLVLDTGLFPGATPDWERACDPLIRTIASWAPSSPPRVSEVAPQEPPKGNHWSMRLDHMMALAEGE